MIPAHKSVTDSKPGRLGATLTEVPARRCLFARPPVPEATVAQAAEQRFCKPQVGGSSPPGGCLAPLA